MFPKSATSENNNKKRRKVDQSIKKIGNEIQAMLEFDMLGVVERKNEGVMILNNDFGSFMITIERC